MPQIEIDWLGGNCPVQAEGTVDGEPFYFRARGEHWSMGIGGEPVGYPAWKIKENYPGDQFAAGWMAEDEARTFIEKAAAAWAAQRQSE